MLHNGKFFIFDDVVYCIGTGSGGLAQSTEWAKLYYKKKSCHFRTAFQFYEKDYVFIKNENILKKLQPVS
jgi:hypothetical protein